MAEPIPLRTTPVPDPAASCEGDVVRSLIGAISVRELRSFLASRSEHPAGSVRQWSETVSPLPSSSTLVSSSTT